MAFEWYTIATSHDNCKTYRINDLKQKKLVSMSIHGIVQNPDYVIEILGAREKTAGDQIHLMLDTQGAKYFLQEDPVALGVS